MSGDDGVCYKAELGKYAGPVNRTVPSKGSMSVRWPAVPEKVEALIFSSELYFLEY